MRTPGVRRSADQGSGLFIPPFGPLSAVYQARFVSRMIPDDRKYYIAWRYVERNPLKARYVERAEDWPWCSAWHAEGGPMLFHPDPGPLPKLPYWSEFLNQL